MANILHTIHNTSTTYSGIVTGITFVNDPGIQHHADFSVFGLSSDFTDLTATGIGYTIPANSTVSFNLNYVKTTAPTGTYRSTMTIALTQNSIPVSLTLTNFIGVNSAPVVLPPSNYTGDGSGVSVGLVGDPGGTFYAPSISVLIVEPFSTIVSEQKTYTITVTSPDGTLGNDTTVYTGSAIVDGNLSDPLVPLEVVGGGGSGDNNSVCADAYMPGTDKRAGQMTVGDPLTLLSKDRQGTMPGIVIANRVTKQKVLTLVSESGIRLTCSENTPLTLEDGSAINSTEAMGKKLPVQDNNGFRWELIVDVLDAGTRDVATIYCEDQCYAAGDKPDCWIWTHNTSLIKGGFSNIVQTLDLITEETI